MYHTLAGNWEALTKGRFGFSSFILTGLKRYLTHANGGLLTNYSLKNVFRISTEGTEVAVALTEMLGRSGLLQGSESPGISRTPPLCHLCVHNQQRHETAEHGDED